MTRYTAVSFTNLRTQTSEYYALETDDVLTFSGGQADAQQITCVTSFTVKLGGRQSLKCVGKNPGLFQAKSKNDKNIFGLLNQIEAGKIGGAFTFCLNDALDIPAAVENSDHSYRRAAVIYGIIDDKIIYRYPMHPHAFPRFPIHDSIPGQHKIKRPDFFPDTVYLALCCLRCLQVIGDVRINLPQIIFGFRGVDNEIGTAHIPNSRFNSASTSSAV